MPQRVSLMGVTLGSHRAHRFAGLLLYRSPPAARAVFRRASWPAATGFSTLAVALTRHPRPRTCEPVAKPCAGPKRRFFAAGLLMAVRSLRTLSCAALPARLFDHPSQASCPREPGSSRVPFLPTTPDRPHAP